MQIWSFALLELLNKKEPDPQEQHIENLAIARLNNLECSEDFSTISVASQEGNTNIGYVYFYLDDTSLYKPFCYDSYREIELIISGGIGGARYGVVIDPRIYEQGTYTFEGGIKEIATDKTVQTFTIEYTKVD